MADFYQKVVVTLNSKLFTAFLLLSLITTFLYIFFELFRYEAMNQIEFAHIGSSLMLSRGLSPYQDLLKEVGPHACYGPLFYLIPALVGKALGTHTTPYAFLMTHRMISFIYVLMISGMVYIFFRKFAPSKNLCLMGVAALSHWLLFNMSFFRPDFPALLLNILALYIFIETRKKNIFTISLLLIMACFFKQTYIVLPISLFIYLLLKKEIRSAIIMATTFIAVTIPTILALQNATNSQFIHHTYTLFKLTPAFRTLGEQITFFLNSGPFFWGLILLSGGALIASKNKAYENCKIDTIFLTIYFVFLVGAILFFTRSVGVSRNHFLELIFLCIWMAVILITKILSDEGSHAKFGLVATLLFVLLFGISINSILVVRNIRAEVLGIRGRYDKILGYEKELEQIPKGKMLSDSTIIPYKANHPEAAAEGIMFYKRLMPNGNFDIKGIQDRIKKHYYESLVLKKNSRFHHFFGEEISSHYQQASQIAKYIVWVPNDKKIG